jgi:hypothetical protein
MKESERLLPQVSLSFHLEQINLKSIPKVLSLFDWRKVTVNL